MTTARAGPSSGLIRPRSKSLHGGLKPPQGSFHRAVSHERYDSSSSQHKKRLRIAYTDNRFRENVYRLLRAAQESAPSGPANDNSVFMAKKALRFRNLLANAQAADVTDPAFDVSRFMHVTWLKREKSN